MGVGGHAQVRCSREEVIDGGGQVQRGDVIALPSEDSFDGEPADSERETRSDFRKSLEARMRVRGSVRPDVARLKARSRCPASFAAANQRPGSPLESARSERSRAGSISGYFLVSCRKVASPVLVLLAVSAYWR
jgi:hypothetical protein